MRFSNSFDQSQYVSYVTENSVQSSQSESGSLKSKSLNDLFQNDVEKRLRLLLENGGPHYNSEVILNDTYSSSTDYPLYGDEHYVINDNFTLSPRLETNEQMTVTMDDIGESKTEDLLSDDSKDMSSLECSSLSEHSPVYSKVKTISGQEKSPKKYVSEITVFPKLFDDNQGIMKTVQDEHSESQTRNVGASRENSLTSDSDPSFSPRIKDTDTEFFMEAEFLDAAMKPKKSRFQKLFGGKKGRYSPSAQDMPPLSAGGHSPPVPKKQAVKTAAPDLVLAQEHANQSQTDLVKEELGESVVDQMITGHLAQQSRNFKDEITNSGHLTQQSRNCNDEITDTRHLTQQSKEVRVERTVKDVRFSVERTLDDTCIESYSGSLLREGRITPCESSVLRDRHEPADVISRDEKDGVYLASPVVISSGRGSCLDLGVSDDNIPQLDAVSDPDMSRVCMSGSSAQTDQSTPYMFDSVTSSEKPLVGCETSNTISHTTDTDVESSINTASHKTDVKVKLGSTISHTTDPDFITYNTASNTTDHDMSYFSEGFDHLETFDERFDGSFSVSGSDHLNNSLSARSIWSECKDLTEADNSFEDVFDGSFTPRSTESKEPSCQIKEEGDLKEEKEKSSGYGSENSRQTSETRDEPFSDEEKSNPSKVIVEIPRHPSVDLNDEDVDRIFEMAKDPPTFADVDDALSFGELNTDYSVVLDSKGMNDIVEVAEPVAFQANTPIKVKSDSESGEICDESIVPQLSHQSPPLSKNKVPSRLCKGNSQMTSSTCSDDIEDIADAGSTASKLYESDEMGMSSESEAIRSAFDFLSSSSEVEALTSARDRLRILEEEDSGEDEDLASSIKILSDLRKSLLSENEDLLFEQGFIHEEVTEIEREDSKPPSPPTISEDDDSSFQVDPKPAGIHVEIQVDIHHPNVEDSDNGSEIDAPLDVLDEETMVGAGMLLLPENHVDDDDEATTPRPMEEDLDASINPFNRTFTVSADCNGDDVSIKSSNLATSGGLVRSSLADELKLPLWEKFPDLSSSEMSTPRGYESSTMEDSIPDSSFDVSYRSVELNNDVNKIIPAVSPKAVHKSETENTLDNPEMDEKGSLGLIKEAYSDRSSGGISQRYIKKSEMDRKKALLRRQKEVERDEVNDEGEVIEDDWESHGECVSEDMDTEELTLHAQNQRQITHQSGNNFKELFEDSVDVVDGANRIDPVDNDVSESTVSSLCDIASSRSENSAHQAPEFIMGSEDVSPRHLTQTDLPEAEVSLSEEMDVSGSSGEVWFDDLNNKTLNEKKGSLTSVLSPRADAYRKASDSCDSAKSDDSASPTDLREHRYNLPDVVQSQGLQPESDNKLDQVKVKTRRKENPYARISEDGSISDDSQEESFDLSLNSFISPYATTKSLAKISSTPKSHYKSKAAELSCDGIEPVYDPYATIDSPKGDNSDRRKSGGSDINPYATLNEVTAADLNDGVLHSSKDVLVEASGELSAQSSVDVGDRKSHGGMKIPEIRIEAPSEDEADEEDGKKGKCLDDLYAKVMKDRSKGDDPDTSKDETNLNSSTSQSSKGENSFTTPSEEELLGACGGCEELLDTNDEGPPLPSRRYERSISSESTLRSSKALSASKSSLFTNFKDTARVRFQTMRKAMSMDRGLDEVNHDEKNKSGKKEKGEKVKEKNKGEKEKKEKKKKSDGKMKKAPSLKSLSSLFGRKNRDRLSSVEGEGEENIDEPVKKGKKERGFFKSKKKRQISTPISTVDMPTHFRCIGKLKAVNPDGSQIIELSKPPDGPIGFYIAKGTVNYDYGIFVSRFTDDQQKLFAGILGVGDEILEVNDQSVQDKSLDDVYALMAETDKPIMKVFPIVARKEV
ncbi:uncharacterized protein [Haliotis cracherodii]|uniref:uncharacterized protein n=1 Tax=Haliotis cracherodii TaxID=6455 RepID=UPI0039ECC52F